MNNNVDETIANTTPFCCLNNDKKPNSNCSDECGCKCCYNHVISKNDPECVCCLCSPKYNVINSVCGFNIYSKFEISEKNEWKYNFFDCSDATSILYTSKH